ncbi:MAG: GFA family protein [Pseudomonadota bacterium]
MKGRCLCGAVQFSCAGQPRGVAICHCGQCREWTSGPFMAVFFPDGVTVEAGDHLRWYKSSEKADRGFCAKCGSSLFFRSRDTESRWNVSAGALGDHLFEIKAHAWVEDQPDWYAFADDTPRLRSTEFRAARQEGRV